MAKWSEVIYMVNDSLKLKSDDSSITPEHIEFLLLQYRSLLLSQRYTDQKRTIPVSNYQTICVEIDNDFDCAIGDSISSIETIPTFSNLKGNESVHIKAMGVGFADIEYTYIGIERFPYTGVNKWLRNIIYFTTSTDGKLLLKSANPNFKYLKKVQVSGLFENPRDALALSCDENGNLCNYLDSEFPLEAALIPVLLGMVVEFLGQSLYRPEDDINNAADNLSDANYGYKDDRRNRRVQSQG